PSVDDSVCPRALRTWIVSSPATTLDGVHPTQFTPTRPIHHGPRSDRRPPCTPSPERPDTSAVPPHEPCRRRACPCAASYGTPHARQARTPEPRPSWPTSETATHSPTPSATATAPSSCSRPCP